MLNSGIDLKRELTKVCLNDARYLPFAFNASRHLLVAPGTPIPNGNNAFRFRSEEQLNTS